MRALMFLTRSWARGSEGWRERMYSASARAWLGLGLGVGLGVGVGFGLDVLGVGEGLT